MWNLAEPGSRFRAAAPNHPETLSEEPQAFQAVGEKLGNIQYIPSKLEVYRMNEWLCSGFKREASVDFARDINLYYTWIFATNVNDLF